MVILRFQSLRFLSIVAKIRVLSDQTINEIAAGEVIENPASVVKELTENALDAGATEIVVEIKGGGRQLIRIVDDGCGMSREDALLCLERHATSKIREAAEIFAVGTLGFRGEAMPSIASISKLMVLTSPRETAGDGNGEGTLVSVEGGKLVSSGPAVRAPGTTVEVKQLFFNVPVRRKFQRSPAYDAQEIEKVCLHLALAHPQITFQLISDGESRFRVCGSRGPEALRERVSGLLGAELAEALRLLEVSDDGIELTGYIGLPHLHRPNRSGQYLFVNDRSVMAAFLSHAVKDSYGTLLPTHRHPFFILKLTLPPGSVDVNVHPQKREIRFLYEGGLRELVRRGVAAALHGGGVAAVPSDRVAAWAPTPTPTSTFDFLSGSEAPSLAVSAPSPLSVPSFVMPFSLPSPPTSMSPSPPPPPLPVNPLPWEDATTVTTASPPAVLATLVGYLLLDGAAALQTPLLLTPPAEVPALFLVDQRRAHQRVLYEKLCAAHASQAPAAQALLFPPAFHLTPADSLLLAEHRDTLAAMGIPFQQTGPHSWTLEALPPLLGDVDPQKLIDQLLAAWRHASTSDAAVATLLAKQLCTAATHASLKTTTRLSLPQGNTLLAQLYSCRQPALCPLGRPTALCLHYEELQRRLNS